MFELNQVGEKSYYINCPAKIGIYRLNDTDVYLIDSGKMIKMQAKSLQDTERKWMEFKRHHQYTFKC